LKRRLKNKLGNKYNILKEAERQKHKRKGNRCIRYELLPMGEDDKIAMLNDEITPDYPYATHWFLDIYYWKVNNTYQIRVFPCSKFGGSPTLSPVLITVLSDVNEDNALETFEEIVDDIKNRIFWD